MLGCGMWEAFITLRGGAPHPEMPPTLPITGFSLDRVLNETSSARLELDCERFDIREFVHEVHLYRDSVLEWIGTPSAISSGRDAVVLEARDLSAWLDHRVLEREMFFDQEDLAFILTSAVEVAMVRDPSPGLSADALPTGIKATRQFRTVDRRMAGEELRDLASSGIDWTTHLRNVVARGGDSVTTLGTPLLDEHVYDVQTTTSTLRASEVFVLGRTDDVEGVASSFPGSAIGLVQTILTGQSRAKDDPSAATVAQETLVLLSRPPLELTAALKPEAPYAFSDLIPGVVFNVQDIETLAHTVRQPMQLIGVSVSENPEKVQLRLVSA